MEDVVVNREQTIVVERLGGVAGVVVVTETGQAITAFRVRLTEERRGGDERRRDGRGGDPGGGFDRGGSDGGGFGRNGRGRGGRDFGGFSRGRGGERWRSVNDPAGAFSIKDINPGRYSLEVLADGFARTSVPVTVEDGLVTDGVQVALAEGLSIAGSVVRKGT